MSKAKPKRALALPLVALAIFLPVLAACGESDDSSGGSGAAPPTAAAGGGAAGKDNNQYVKFAQCMRKNGVPQWPDPVDGDKFRMPSRTAVDPKSPQFKAATQACRSVAPPGWDGSSRQNTANQAQMLKYAQCMRKNGVPKFPDDGALDTNDVNPDSPQFKAADQKCQSLRPTGAGG
jgi:hypothetical protein